MLSVTLLALALSATSFTVSAAGGMGGMSNGGQMNQGSNKNQNGNMSSSH